jgi:hypothetical protein
MLTTDKAPTSLRTNGLDRNSKDLSIRQAPSIEPILTRPYSDEHELLKHFAFKCNKKAKKSRGLLRHTFYRMKDICLIGLMKSKGAFVDSFIVVGCNAKIGLTLVGGGRLHIWWYRLDAETRAIVRASKHYSQAVSGRNHSWWRGAL